MKEAIYIGALILSLNSGRYNLHPVWKNITKERENGAGITNRGGGGLRNSVSVPVSLQHTDEGYCDSWKLCKGCQTLSRVIQLQHVSMYITSVDEST